MKPGPKPMADAAIIVIPVKVSRDLNAQLRERARKTDRSVSGYIRHLLREHLGQL